MNTRGKIITGALIVGVPLTVYVGSLLTKSSASDKLLLDVTEFDLALRGADNIQNLLSAKIVAEIGLKITNPTKTELSFSNLFLKVSVLDKKGQKVLVGNTAPSTTGTVLPKYAEKKIPVTINVPLQKMLGVFPDYLTYMWGVMHGEKRTRKAFLEYTYNSSGFELSGSSTYDI